MLHKVKIAPAAIDWGKEPRGFFNANELETIVALMYEVRPEYVVETGCNIGRTAKLVLQHVPGIVRYTGIDVFPGYKYQDGSVQKHETPTNAGERAKGDPRFRLHVSEFGSRDVTADYLGPADCVFIDGDHSVSGVTYDTQLAESVIRPGGMIIWHDYHDLNCAGIGVKEVLDLRAKTGDLYHVEGTWLVFQRF